MQFVVPQFIDIEPKIIGPISVRQFVILLITAALVYAEFELFGFWVFVISALITTGIGLVIAFVKVNSQPFHIFMIGLIQTFRKPNLRVWSREVKTVTLSTDSSKKKKDNAKQPPAEPKGPLSSSDVAELSLIADTGGKYTSDNI